MLYLLWFCFTTPSDWLKKVATLSQPIRRKGKTNLHLLARVFPRLTLIVFASISDWLTLSFVPFMIG